MIINSKAMLQRYLQSRIDTCNCTIKSITLNITNFENVSILIPILQNIFHLSQCLPMPKRQCIICFGNGEKHAGHAGQELGRNKKNIYLWVNKVTFCKE